MDFCEMQEPTKTQSVKFLETSCEMRTLQNQIKFTFGFVAYYKGENGDYGSVFECISGEVPTEKALRVADFNGDGLDDVLCHERSGTINIVFNTFSKLEIFKIFCKMRINEI